MPLIYFGIALVALLAVVYLSTTEIATSSSIAFFALLVGIFVFALKS